MVWHSAGRSPAASRGITSGSSSKRRLSGEQRVERRVAAADRGRARAGRSSCGGRGGPARPCRPGWPGCRAAAEWKAPPSDSVHLGVAVPAEVERPCPPARAGPATLQPGRGGAGVHDEVAAAGCVGRQREVDAERRGDAGARPASTSTSVTRTPGIRASSRATQQPTMPAPTTVTRSPTSGAASHRALTAVSTVPASTARAGGHVLGDDDHRAAPGRRRRSGAGRGRRRCGRAASAGPCSTTPTFR